ncbi:hypothetical protein [Sporomusa sp. KB1]|jgi:hypothetical protein|uniref:hypothetical protein n=1 Tax=Sporomusa sp. KB1 TaxID=943346 RepID=UPI00119DB9C3|nr:hypothetical protein [Sporomusa sp. KB1]TWH48289.1 hypothetical protein Salpa_4435 [Sporomusa sp. KB1]
MSKKMIILFIILLFSSSASCFAITLSQPVEIGSVYTKDLVRYGSQSALPTSLKDKYYDFGKDKVVRLYVNFYGQDRFGDTKNINNTVSLREGRHRSAFYEIFEIAGNKGEVFYVIGCGGTDGYSDFAIIGKTSDGKYITYVSRNHFENLHPTIKDSVTGPTVGAKIAVEDDTIVLNCGRKGMVPPLVPTFWQYRLKWDDKAQWFGIEYIPLRNE